MLNSECEVAEAACPIRQCREAHNIPRALPPRTRLKAKYSGDLLGSQIRGDLAASLHDVFWLHSGPLLRASLLCSWIAAGCFGLCRAIAQSIGDDRAEFDICCD